MQQHHWRLQSSGEDHLLWESQWNTVIWHSLDSVSSIITVTFFTMFYHSALTNDTQTMRHFRESQILDWTSLEMFESSPENCHAHKESLYPVETAVRPGKQGWGEYRFSGPVRSNCLLQPVLLHVALEEPYEVYLFNLVGISVVARLFTWRSTTSSLLMFMRERAARGLCVSTIQPSELFSPQTRRTTNTYSPTDGQRPSITSHTETCSYRKSVHPAASQLVRVRDNLIICWAECQTRY